MQADRKAPTPPTPTCGCATQSDAHPFIRAALQHRFAAWLADEQEIDHDPFLDLTPPKIDTKVVERLTNEELRLMLKACAGDQLHDCRDEVRLRLLLETGMRNPTPQTRRSLNRPHPLGSRGCWLVVVQAVVRQALSVVLLDVPARTGCPGRITQVIAKVGVIPLFLRFVPVTEGRHDPPSTKCVIANSIIHYIPCQTPL